MLRNVLIISRMCVAVLVTLVGQAVFVPSAYAASPTGPAQPSAAASQADLSVRLSGLQLNHSIDHKVITVTVTNHGPTAAQGIVLKVSGWVDSESVDPGTVDFCPPPWANPGQQNLPEPPPRVVDIDGECKVRDLVAGQSVKLYSRTELWDGGDQIGEISVAVSHAGTDPVPTNNFATGRILVD